MSEKRCYTVQELQEILGVSRPTILLWSSMISPERPWFPLQHPA